MKAAAGWARVLRLLLAGWLLTVADLAAAHHSASMFDFDKCMAVSGTVRTLEWAFPHVWLWVEVPDGKNPAKVWGFESGSPASLTRKGWTRTALKPGDKVSVRFFPLKDGQAGGNMATVRTADGHELPSVPFPCELQPSQR